jgi:CHAT domain-containing protein
VVLSACNTIAGDKPGAEALSGLARSTFDRLKADPKIGRAQALRQAMLFSPKNACPAFWGPLRWSARVRHARKFHFVRCNKRIRAADRRPPGL